MTQGFALFTLGALFIYTALKGQTIAQAFQKQPGSERAPIVDTTKYDASEGKGGGRVSKHQKDTDKLQPIQGGGVAKFDGKDVAAWMIPYLKKSREHGWKGSVTSGYRTPQYSRTLCQRMCGADSCPGRCAGVSSNHSGKAYPAGAIDVSDYTRFGEIQKKIGSPLKNTIGSSDPVHFSVSGQ